MVDGLWLKDSLRRRRSTIDRRSTINHQPSTLLILLALIGIGPASGCVQQMANQPRVDTGEPVEFFADGEGLRPPVEGTIARGQLPAETVMETGKQAGAPVEQIPVEVTAGLMNRGQERFGIFCSHCHGPAGYGNGMVVQRGFPAPPSYHIQRLRTAPAGHFFSVISNGHGRMPAFGRRIEPRDRWAIVAYVRALQLSQGAQLDELPAKDRDALTKITEGSSE